MGFIQTETPYYQPNPLAPTPFSVVSSLNDPNFATSCSGQSGNCAESWGLRVINSQNVLIYGAGHYSFFNNYDTSKSRVITLKLLILTSQKPALTSADPRTVKLTSSALRAV